MPKTIFASKHIFCIILKLFFKIKQIPCLHEIDQLPTKPISPGDLKCPDPDRYTYISEDKDSYLTTFSFD